MTRDEFDALVKRLEGISQKQPSVYAMRVAGLVALAYGYLGMVLLGTLALCIAIGAIMFYAPSAVTFKFGIIGIIAFGSVFLAILNGLWVTLEPPKGQVVTRKQAPKLFGLLDELRSSLNCRPFHEVLVISDLNAAVVQVPRLGVFGWHRNYLLIGLPLMESLSPGEFKAVLAHEFAHSSQGHGRYGNWLYRVRQSWNQIFAEMGRRRSIGRSFFQEFINWYWPIFNGHAFVLARANEYVADECSVRLTNAETAANALMRLKVDAALMAQKFWPEILARANEVEQPPTEVMAELQHRLKAGPTADEAARWLRQSFLIETNNIDTHPCLKDRLQAIGRLPTALECGEIPSPPPVPAESAAECYLGEHLQPLAKELSLVWHKGILAQWKSRHEQAQKLTGELAELDKKMADAPLTSEVLWEKAYKVLNLHGDEAVLPLLEQVLAKDPQHAGANFVTGRHFLQTDNDRGVEFIEAAMDFDPFLTGDGCNLLYLHYARTGQRDKLRPLELRADQFKVDLELGKRERARVTADDTFIPHELTEAQIADAQKVFAAEPSVALAAVAKKELKYFCKKPCFVVAIHADGPFLNMANPDVIKRLADHLKLPGNFLVFMDAKNLMPVADKVFKVPDASIYRR